jgi:ABC-type multidrug transport system fused ATPase/permease subunit
MPPHRHPSETASACSRLFLCWAAPLLRAGYRAPLTSASLPPLPARAEVLAAHAALQALRAARPREPLALTLTRLVRGDLVVSGVAMAVYLGALLANPLLLRELVNALTRNDARAAAGFGVGLGCAAAVAAVTNAHHLFIASRIANVLRVASITAIFRASLQRPPPTVELRAEAGGGGGDVCAPRRARPDASALLASDAERFASALPLLHNLWVAPAIIVVSTYFLVSFLGAAAAFAGVAVLVATLPLNGAVLGAAAAARRAQANAADLRVRETADALAGITAIKLAAGEATLAKRLGVARVAEVRHVARGNTLFATSTAIAISTPVVSMVAMFAAFTLTGRVHDAGSTFAALAFLNVIRFPLMNLGTLFSALSQLLVSTRRIEAFLVEEESAADAVAVAVAVDDDGAEASHARPVSPPPSIIHLSAATFVWPRAAGTGTGGADALRQLVIRDLSLSLNRGELCVVVGPVGAGKSSLLLALLGEMPRALPRGVALPSTATTRGLVEGAVVGFAPQTPVLFNGSLRENVVFGAPFDKDTYVAVLRACALFPDIQLFGPSRDLTIIGERGVTLSGGQRARVGLARAAFALLTADAAAPRLLLADDALAALDAVTGAAVWARLLGPRGIFAARGIARVVVTHARAPLSAANVALVLVDGAVAYCGGPAGLAAAGEAAGAPAFLKSLIVHTSGPATETATATGGGADDGDPSPPDDESLAEGVEGKAAEDEDRATGTVRFSVYQAWAAEGGRGCALGALLFFAFLLERATYVGADVWLSSWVAAASPSSPRTGLASMAAASSDVGGGVAASQSFWLPGYAIFGALNIVGSFGRMLTVSLVATGASARLFDRALWSVLRTHTRFFDVTPLGRILSRLSFDVDVLDSKILQPFSSSMASSAWMLSAVVVMVAVLPWTILVLAPLLLAYSGFVQFVRPALRELQRIDSTTRSPLAATFSESLRGAALLRAHRAVPRFIAQADAQLIANATAVVCFQDSSKWMALCLDLAGAVLTLSVALIGVAAGSALAPALVGLAANWSQNFTISLNFHIVNTTQSESAAIAVERLLAYTSLPSEPALVVCGGAPPADFRAEIDAAVADSGSAWPRGGRVDFEKVCVRYAPTLPRALDGLSFSLPAGALLAVVGRSGSGKSTLAAALFRTVEIEGGSIRVDGEDIAQLGLGRVRGGRAVIIPQEPSVWRGTLRANLDPRGVASDADVWAALVSVQLDALFGSARAGAGAPGVYAGADAGDDAVDARRRAAALAAPVDPATLSVGQRQLLCLARAMLRRPTLLVLDEATASVDGATEARIMGVVSRERALGVTVVNIAHRLDAAMGADFVLVVDAGRAADFGTPKELLARDAGHFAALVRAGGAEREAALRALAQ